jgi:glycosyltransferase involved in cell wall biosynthesis
MTASTEDAGSPPLVVVTPVFEDREASGRLFKELASEFGARVHVVAVDDGSVREPLEIASLTAAGLSGTAIRLRRNVGHQRAIAIGLNYVADRLPGAQRIVVMDSDGEDIPQSIPALLQPLDSTDVDVVVAQRKKRVETWRFRAFYLVYKQLFELLSGRKISFGNFMAMKPAAVKRLTAMQELWIHVAGCVITSKLRIALLPLDRGPRYAGKSKMNFVGLALHGFRALMVFAEDVLVRVGIACAVIATMAVLGSATAVTLKLMGFATPGWFSIALGIMVLMVMQTGAITLMTLMLTGVIRGGSVTSIDYQGYIESVAHARPDAAG